MSDFTVICNNQQRITAYNLTSARQFGIAVEPEISENGELIELTYTLDSEVNPLIKRFVPTQLLNNTNNGVCVVTAIEIDLNDINKYSKYAYEEYYDRFEPEAKKVLIIKYLRGYFEECTLKTPEELGVD